MFELLAILKTHKACLVKMNSDHLQEMENLITANGTVHQAYDFWEIEEYFVTGTLPTRDRNGYLPIECDWRNVPSQKHHVFPNYEDYLDYDL